jgi:hypothetical protein
MENSKTFWTTTHTHTQGRHCEFGRRPSEHLRDRNPSIFETLDEIEEAHSWKLRRAFHANIERRGEGRKQNRFAIFLEKYSIFKMGL